MRLPALVIIFVSASSMAHANLGHLGELAGHGHWPAVGALGIAIVVAGLALKGRKKGKAESKEAEAETEGKTAPQEA